MKKGEESCIFLQISALNADDERTKGFSVIISAPSNFPEKIDAN